MLPRITLFTSLLLLGTTNTAYSQFGSITPDTLIEAAMLGQTKHIKRFLDNGEDINQADEDGETPLLAAIRFKREKAVELLLSHQAKRLGNAIDGETLLDVLVSFDKPLPRNTIELLIKHGQDINAVNADGSNLLQLRIGFHSKHKSLLSDIEYLINLGVDVNNKNDSGASAIWGVCFLEESDDYKAIIDILVNNEADINAKDNDGDNLMAMTGCQESLEIKRYLITKGAEDIY